MCHFISAILPADAGTDAVAAIFRAHGRVCRPRRPDSALAVSLPHGERVFHTTPGHCDCGTPIGRADMAGDAVHAAREAEAARLRRKGWSEAKIARTLAQRDAATARPPRGDSGPAPTSLAAWCALIRAVLASGATASLGLVLHGHGSGDDFEDLPLSAGERVPCGALDEDLLATLREDVGYRFVR